MKSPSPLLRMVVAAGLAACLSACAVQAPSQPAGNLDLGGGISMTPDGQILGATPASPSAVADYADDVAQPVAASPAGIGAVPGGAKQ